nr:unnamed protein product [Haemonchus contortus]
MTFTLPCLLLISALVNAAPHRDTEPLERGNFLMERNRIQEPLDREISLAKLLDDKTSFSRASLDYYLDILNDYKDYVPKEIQTIFAGWWGRVFEAVSAPPNMMANRLADLMADFYEDYSRCDQSVKNEVRSIWPEAYNLLESDFARNFARAARKFADGGLSMDIHILSADAAYPPKAPKMKTENIEKGYREQSGSMNRGPFGLGFNF